MAKKSTTDTTVKRKPGRPKKQQNKSDPSLQEKQDAFFEGGGYIPQPTPAPITTTIAVSLPKQYVRLLKMLTDATSMEDNLILPIADQDVDQFPIDLMLECLTNVEKVGGVILKFPNTPENHRQALFFCSCIYNSDVPVEHSFNTADQYSINVYYSSMGGSKEFIIEKTKTEISLTITKM